MSREVRRVPIDWKHPVKHNPHWEYQAASRQRRSRPESKLHGPTESFVPLFEDYAGSLANWEQEMSDLKNRTGFDWDFSVRYHLTGFTGPGVDEAQIHPHYSFTSDGETEVATDVRDEDHLFELLIPEKESEKPNPEHYLPVFDVPAEDLGWCLYETVSEGTPVTPVFATADELIDHLATVGQDWDQVPMRRTAAETLVRTGGSLGSMLVAGGKLYKSDVDADLIAALPKDPS